MPVLFFQIKKKKNNTTKQTKPGKAELSYVQFSWFKGNFNLNWTVVYISLQGTILPIAVL